jgi:hypothetical protein
LSLLPEFSGGHDIAFFRGGFMFKHILLCTHGTAGAQKAERFVFEKMAGDPDLKVTLLTVLDEDWRGMTGDDWLNSSKTQATFLDHVEGQVSAEIKGEWERIRQCYPEASKVKFVQKTGTIAEAIAGVAKDLECDGIIIGAYQKPKGLFSRTDRKGLKDTLKNNNLHPILPCPLIITP